MPEAIATTKRKFYKALDSISNPPATRPHEPAAKRVRRSVSGGSTLASTRATALPSKSAAVPARPPPNYSPWSHETFLERLKTFSSVSKWHPKPDAVNEVEWAKRGWVCVDVNTVACKGGCEKRVVVSLTLPTHADGNTEGEGEEDADGDEDGNEDGEEGFEEALIGRYTALLVDGHADSCPWRKAGCKEDIYRLQVVRPHVWQPELRTRYQSLLHISASTRDIKIATLAQDTTLYITPEKLLSELPRAVLDTADTQSSSLPDDAKALEIALHGWRGSSDAGNDLLHCDACFQRIGLWMYQPDYKPSHVDEDDENEYPATIDLVEMHRDHCPWRNPATQKASGTLSGQNACQILHRVVSTCAREQRRRSDEALKITQRSEEDEDALEAAMLASPAPSREEVEKQDRERDSRLRKLKALFTIKRKSEPKPTLIGPLKKPK